MNDKGTALNKGAQLIPNGMLDDNYPRNMWWCAAHVDEVTESPSPNGSSKSQWCYIEPAMETLSRSTTAVPTAGHRCQMAM